MNNSSHEISRRNFLKLVLAGGGAAFLTAFRETALPFVNLPTAGTSVTPVPVPTLDPALAALPKFKLLTPSQGSQLKAMGRVTFSWETYLGAASYRLEIISPTGKKVIFLMKSTQHNRYMESLPWGGNFT